MPYLFTRSDRLAPGNLLTSTAWSVKLTEKVNAISEFPVVLWSSVLSPASGTLAWTAIVEDLDQLAALDAKLLADSGYLSLVEEGARYTSEAGADDAIVRLLSADPDAVTRETRYAATVRSVLAPSTVTCGIELGVEIARRATKATGRPTSFGVEQTGACGGVRWMTLYETVDQVQAAAEALAADADFARFVEDEASDVYLTGRSTRAIFSRVT